MATCETRYDTKEKMESETQETHRTRSCKRKEVQNAETRKTTSTQCIGFYFFIYKLDTRKKEK